MIIRALKDTDISQILEIERQSFKTPWSRQAFVDELANPIAHYLVMLDGESVVGYAGFWQILDEGHITNVALLPNYRGRGLGRRLVGRLIELAKQLNIIQMTLEVRPSNDAALALYRQFGFSVQGRRPNYYYDTNEDALIMWLLIEER